MSRQSGKLGPIRRTLTILAVTLSLAAGRAAAGSCPHDTNGPRLELTPTIAVEVSRAVWGAKCRLAEARCHAILTDFTAQASGRTLAGVLEDLGRTPEQHLDGLVFKDGSRHTVCKFESAFAGTRPGGDVVFVCTAPLLRLSHKPGYRAEVIIIHEMLHTLGLRENPPTSREITARVLERCVP